MNKAVLATITTLFIIIVIFIATLPNPIDLPEDIVLHFTAFLVFSMLLLRTLKAYKVRHHLLTTFIISLMIGIIIELIQFTIATRDASLSDLAANLAGTSLALFLK
jgi:VanZ family protein